MIEEFPKIKETWECSDGSTFPTEMEATEYELKLKTPEGKLEKLVVDLDDLCRDAQEEAVVERNKHQHEQNHYLTGNYDGKAFAYGYAKVLIQGILRGES